MLDWLARFPGQDWAERWVASGAEQRGRDWYPRAGPMRAEMTEGLASLLCLRALRPGCSVSACSDCGGVSLQLCKPRVIQDRPL